MTEDMFDGGPVSEQKRDIPREIKRFFNTDSMINPTPDGGYYVETTIKDGDYVPGGQNIVMILGPKIHAPGSSLGSPITEENYIDFLDRYKITKMVVNGKDFPYKEHQICFLALPGDFDINENPELSASMDNMHTHKYVRIFLYQLKTGNHLASLMHEQGHCFSGANYQEFITLVDELHALRQARIPSGISKGLLSKRNVTLPPSISDREQELLLLGLEIEARASQLGLEIIRDLRQEGNDLFPQDPDLVRVINFYKYALDSRLLPELYPGVREVTGDRLPQIFELIQ